MNPEERRLLDIGYMSPEVLQWVAIIKILKTRGGLDFINKFTQNWLHSQAQMVTALAQSGAGNIVVAWSHSHIISMILEQNYMIRKGGAAGIMDGLNKLVGGITFAEIFGQIAVPSVLAFSGAPLAKPGTLKALTQ